MLQQVVRPWMKDWLRAQKNAKKSTVIGSQRSMHVGVGGHFRVRVTYAVGNGSSQAAPTPFSEQGSGGSACSMNFKPSSSSPSPHPLARRHACCPSAEDTEHIFVTFFSCPRPCSRSSQHDSRTSLGLFCRGRTLCPLRRAGPLRCFRSSIELWSTGRKRFERSFFCR